MLRPLLPIAVLLAGCTQPPDVRAVSPSEGPAGTEIRVEGATFDPSLTVSLRPDGAQDAGSPLSLTSTQPESFVGTVPTDLAPGPYTLVIEQNGLTVLVPTGFTVSAPVQDLPCGKLYTANTQVSPMTGVVTIDRFYRDGKRETVRKELAQVDRIEFEQIGVEGGKLCSVIYLRTREGERLRFADDLEDATPKEGLDLEARAIKLGQEINKPVEVTRRDPRPAPKAE